MVRAREYIEEQRKVAIKRTKSRNSTLKPPDELFSGASGACADGLAKGMGEITLVWENGGGLAADKER